MFCGLKGGTPSVHLQRRAETTSQKGLTGCQHLASHWPVDWDAFLSLVRANQGSAPKEDMKTARGRRVALGVYTAHRTRMVIDHISMAQHT